MSTSIICFSKNRPLQLHALLESLEWNFNELQDADITCIVQYTNKDFEDGYNKLQLYCKKNFGHLKLKFVKEKKFKNDVINSINVKNKYVMFLVDDVLFKKFFSVKDLPFQTFSNNKEILALSLRLYKGITHCYSANETCQPPKFVKNHVWKWKEASHDFGYPGSLDGDIFRTSDLVGPLRELNFNNPNELESNLSGHLKHFSNKLYMCCYVDESVLFNVPANRVQQQFTNRVGNIFSAEELNEKYLSGQIIDVDDTIENCKNNNSVHFEVVYKFKSC